MSDINNGGPAFPAHPSAMGDHDGMTLRDYFAAKADEGDIKEQVEIIRQRQLSAWGGIGTLPNGWRVEARYMHADAMLKAREVQQ